MSWREKLEPGSFRGVSFRVDSQELAGGRRVAVHEYPFKNTPFTEDMGRKGRSVSFDAYLVGPDYLTGRDALIDALEASGPGELVLPLYGRLNVQAGEFTARETRDDGGMVRFSLQFLETTTGPFPRSVDDNQDAVDSAGLAVAEAIDAGLVEELDPVGLPEWALGVGSDALAAASDAMGAVLGPIQFAMEYAADINRQVQALKLKATSLVRDPVALAQNARNIFDTLANAGADPFQVRTAMDDLFSALGSEDTSATTNTRRKANGNRAAIQNALRRSALILSARQLARESFASEASAIAARDTFLDAIDLEAETANDGLYALLDELRATVSAAVPGEDNTAPRLVDVYLPASIPALVLSYQLYGDALRGDEIAARNNASHSSFLPGGGTVKVLVDG